MKSSNFGSVDLAFSILGAFDIGGTIITRKDSSPSSSGLERDIDQLHNDYMLIVEDYKKSTSKLCAELEKTLNRKK